MSEPIVGKKVILFPAHVKDIDYFVSLLNENEHQVEVFRGVKPEVIKDIITERMHNGSIRIWLATTKQGKGSRNIGFLYLTNILPFRANVHGFLDKTFLRNIIKEMEGRYTYTEDCYRTFIDWCFNNLGIERLETIIKRTNTLAYRIDKKVGFKIEGILRSYIQEEDNSFSDIVVMAILKGERLKASPAISSDKTAQLSQEV